MPYPSLTRNLARMIHQPPIASLGLLTLLLVPLVACNESDQIASTCDGGVCQGAQLTRSDALRCQIGNSVAELETWGSDPEDPPLSELCLPREFAAGEDGLITCDVTLAFGAEGACDAHDYLSPTDEPGTCELAQIPAFDGLPTGDGKGWYYGPNDPELCGGVGAKLVWSPGILPDRVPMRLLCSYSDVAVGDHISAAIDGSRRVAVDPLQCAAEAYSEPSDLGKVCQVTPPKHGFDDRDATLETGNPGCDTGMCLVYQLQGDPDPGCEEPSPDDCDEGCFSRFCASQQEIEARMQCTCRCDAPDPDTDVCACGEAQTCTPLIFTGPLAGSYCVNSEIL